MKRRSIMIVTVFLLVLSNCKDTDRIRVASVNGKGVYYYRSTLANLDTANKNSDISFLIEKEILLQYARERGLFEDKQFTDLVESQRPSVAFNVYVDNIRSKIKVSESEIKNIFENDPEYEGKEYNLQKDLIKDGVINERLGKKIIQVGNGLKNKYKIEINKEYLDTEKYPPEKTSLVVARVDRNQTVTNNELVRIRDHGIAKDKSYTLEDALEHSIARHLVYLESQKIKDSKKINEMANDYLEKRILSYMQYNYIFEKFPVNDENMRKFYEESLDAVYKKPKRAKVRQILFSPEDEDNALQLAEETLKIILNTKKDPQKKFIELARKYQKGPEILKENAGDLGEIPENVMPEEFTKAAFSMTKDGIYKEVVFSKEYGYHLIMTEYIMQEEIPEYSDILEQVRSDYRRYVREIEYARFLDELCRNARIRIYHKEYSGRFKKYEKR